MIFDGTHKIPAQRETVWQALMNPEILARALPGCEKLEANPDGSYHAQMKVGIAAIKGTYQGRIEILDATPPERFRMKVDGQGTGGFLKAEGTLTLTGQENETLISYSGEAHVGGGDRRRGPAPDAGGRQADHPSVLRSLFTAGPSSFLRNRLRC